LLLLFLNCLGVYAFYTGRRRRGILLLCAIPIMLASSLLGALIIRLLAFFVHLSYDLELIISVCFTAWVPIGCSVVLIGDFLRLVFEKYQDGWGRTMKKWS